MLLQNSSDNVVICDPLSISARVSIPFISIGDSLLFPTSLNNVNFIGAGLALVPGLPRDGDAYIFKFLVPSEFCVTG